MQMCGERDAEADMDFFAMFLLQMPQKGKEETKFKF
jgi:hypothetical protein